MYPAAALSGVLSGLYALMEQLGGPGYSAFLAFGKRAVLNGLSKVGWDPRESDGHTDKLLRTTLIGLLDTFAWDDPEVVTEARRRFEGHWNNPALLPSDYKTTVYKIVLLNGGEAEYELIFKTFYATDDNAEKRFAYALGVAQSTALKLRTLDWAIKSGDIKLQDFFYPIGPVASSLSGADLAWSYFQEVRYKSVVLSCSLISIILS
jgi:hypothetical protein